MEKSTAPIAISRLGDRLIDAAREQELRDLVKWARTHRSRNAVVAEAAGSAMAWCLPVMQSAVRSKVVVVCDDADEAGYMYHDLCRTLGEERVLIFPSGYKRDIKYGQIDAPQEILRTEVLNRWSSDKQLRVVVAYPEALAEKVASSEEVERQSLRIVKGSTVDYDGLAQRLRELGFQEVDYVYEPGQFALRGSIVDIYSYSNELPYRLDFFDDEIDSLRTFNVETQLSEQQVEEATVVADMGNTAESRISLLDYADDNTLLVVHNPGRLLERVTAIGQEVFSESSLLAGEGDARAMDKVVDAEAFADRLRQLTVVGYTAGSAPADADKSVALGTAPQGIYHKNFDLIGRSFRDFIAEGYAIYILSDSAKQIERLRAIFDDRGDDISFQAVQGTIHEGFIDNRSRVCVFTDHQIFDRFHKYSLKSDRARSGRLALSLKELSQIEVGDYVVHADHGVGQFGGLVRTPVSGTMQEMIKLVYQNNDTIFVSIHALHKLSKYRGKEGVPPRLNKLGSGAWNRMKQRTKSRLKDIARDLIKLYAERRQQSGFAFSPDGYLQHELEASFIYEDTPDQLKASIEVKNDMQRPQPMDRLICGDVGFGKTEIAIRAAFKAATDGKQTAVLVPTTVLAFQHYNTFKERLKEFPVRVEYLSRARTAKQTREVLADLEAGKIDIVIGTHKLVGKDVKFKDLGLLVIDEEQKFGVAVKEKLKQMKVNVDTLTMSATPIPRTLQFSLMGARDLSSINTPPPNRHPIITTVGTLNDDVVAEAINFELSRNGQVFFVNNRIEQLPALENMIHRLVPDARVVVAHGQMKPEQLERAIIDFTGHDYDILLATAIIESGIDMPNVNTIVINNAQNFGLSDLHQLRGRVGRSSRKAFCYMLVPPGKPLSQVAHRRLQAIESFSDLGSGIHIAMQDLDIRGAGNLLGAEQSGFIADLGYETYQRVLQEAVLELRTEEFADTFAEQNADADNADFVADCIVETDMEILFPATYVPQESERIALYQELDSIEQQRDVDAFRERLLDRFGRIPEQGEELIRIVTLRRLARRLGIEKVALKQGLMYLYFVGDDNRAYYQSSAFGRILAYLQRHPQRCQLRERQGKRSIAVTDVTTVLQAVDILTEVRSLDPA